MAAAPKSSPPTLFDKLGLKPLTRNNVLYHYGPIAGAASYTALAVNLSSPNVLRKLFPHHDVSNILLLTSIAGLGTYVYGRNHIAKASPRMKIVYSLYCSGTLCLSSVLVWAILRTFVPDNPVIHAVTGVGSSIGLLLLGKNYNEFVDRR